MAGPVSEPQLEFAAADELFVVELGVVPRPAVELGAADVAVVGRIVVRRDDELAPGVVVGVEPDGHPVEDRRGDVVIGHVGFGSRDAEQTDAHERAHAAHLTLVLVVAAVTLVGGDAAVGAFLDLAHPVLREPRLAAVGEQVGVRTAGLVGIAHITAAVGVDEIEFPGLFEGVVELVAEGVASAHQFDEFRQVVRYRPCALPAIGLDPAPAVQRIEVEPFAVLLFGEDQPLFGVEQRCPSVGAAFELPGVGLLAQARRHAAQTPVLKRPFERLARVAGAPAVADVEFQVVGVLVAHHASRQVVAFDDLVGVQRVGLLHDAFHVGAYQHAARRTARHDERVASRAGAARQQAAVVGILHQTGREVVHDLGHASPRGC